MSHSLTESLFSLNGRITRRRFWSTLLALIALFVFAFMVLQEAIGRGSTLILYPFFFWIGLCLAGKRYHDLGRSTAWLLMLLIPLLGPVWVGIELFFRRGTYGGNRFGDDPRASSPDYLQVRLG